ncbi:hypothetical protein BD324DRAFT_448539 [Kockovaella imperatae]|uniref:Uncharacterized protein n=1 Tax=Kockovaella imperatae TaxID=4999 RepID=A0A1Y1UHE4_9TREE|nr:hypothetical protein BD324DRAFT_448539 [Kockovaella imperatae]ORX37409.1 hypothetical protein BD324DRAFT_448539 [Kockovaella imperatae]
MIKRGVDGMSPIQGPEHLPPSRDEETSSPPFKRATLERADSITATTEMVESSPSITSWDWVSSASSPHLSSVDDNDWRGIMSQVGPGVQPLHDIISAMRTTERGEQDEASKGDSGCTLSDSKLITRPVDEPRSRGSPTTSIIDVEQFPSTELPNPNAILHSSMQALQAQLATVQSRLAALIPFAQPDPDETAVLSSDPLPVLTARNRILERNLQAANDKNASLERTNANLTRALNTQRNIVKKKEHELAELRPFVPPPDVMPGNGIDPAVISELANDLISGVKTVDEIASSLLDLVETAGGTLIEKERQDLHPVVRLNNLEGVLDVTLGRVAALEKDTKRLVRREDEAIYQRCEAADTSEPVMSDWH